MEIREITLSGDLQGTLLVAASSTRLGVVVLAGSSGRVDVERARLFATHGVKVIALRWFGGEGQVPGICEVPLESFSLAVDKLLEKGCEQVAFVGTSKGAEAALLTAIYDHRIDKVVAISPSSVVWANIGAGRDGAEWPQRSSWTYRGAPLPFISYDTEWTPLRRAGPVSYRSLYEQSLRTFAADVAAATIPIEKARAEVLLVAGVDDALWPSDTFTHAIADRLTAMGRSASLICHPKAGHRVLLPGKTTPRSTKHAHGGDDQSDRDLGRAAWSQMSSLLHLLPS